MYSHIRLHTDKRNSKPCKRNTFSTKIILSNTARSSLLYFTLHYITLDAVPTQLTLKGFKIYLNIMFEAIDNELYIQGVSGVI